MDHESDNNDKKTNLSKHYVQSTKIKIKSNNEIQNAETVLDTGILYTSDGIKCLTCSTPITIPGFYDKSSISPSNLEERYSRKCISKYKNNPASTSENSQNMEPTPQVPYPHCQKILRILNLFETENPHCKCLGDCSVDCCNTFIPHEPQETRVEIGDNPQIIAKSFWPYNGTLGTILITKVYKPTQIPSAQTSTDDCLSITFKNMLQAARTCSEEHSCSVCTALKDEKCTNTFCEFLIENLDTEGYKGLNSVQLLAKWSEKEHDKQPTNPETAPSDIEQDSYTNKLYNYVNNANNKAKLEVWLKESMQYGGVIIRTEPTERISRNKTITNHPITICSNQQSVIGWKKEKLAQK